MTLMTSWPPWWTLTASHVVTMLSYANSMLNPLLYAAFNENFRAGFARACRCLAPPGGAGGHLSTGGRGGARTTSGRNATGHNRLRLTTCRMTTSRLTTCRLTICRLTTCRLTTPAG